MNSFSIKKIGTLKPWKDREELLLSYGEKKKKQLEKTTDCMISLYDFLEKAKKMDGGRWGGMNRWSTEDLHGSENPPRDSVRMATCCCMYIHTGYTERTIPRVNPNAPSGMGRLRRICVGSSAVTNVPLWWGMLIVQVARHVWGQGVYEKPLCLLFNIAVNIKLL